MEDRGWHHVFSLGVLVGGVWLGQTGWETKSFPEIVGGLTACAYSLLIGAGIELRRVERQITNEIEERRDKTQPSEEQINGMIARQRAIDMGYQPVTGNVENVTVPIADKPVEKSKTMGWFEGAFEKLHTPTKLISNNLTTEQMYIPVPDLRWQDWAMAVINGQPTTQSRWTGKNRKFSKPEYSAQINEWLNGNPPKLVLKNPKNKADGFKPNRAEGWRYFGDLATGREIVPLPHKS